MKEFFVAISMGDFTLSSFCI